MSRTVHHVPLRRRTQPWPTGLAGPHTAHSLTELRYSRAELTRARRTGRRPVPTRVVRSFAAYTFPRALDAHFWSPYEATARADLRHFRTAARKVLRAAPPGALMATAEELDLPPTRHRHRDLW